MSSDPRIIKDSFALLAPNADKAVAYFCGRLFAEHPGLRALFPPAMDAQREQLLRALTRIVWSLDAPDSLTEYLGALGRDHRKLGFRPEHYAAAGTALIATLRRFAGDGWSPRVEAAWTGAFSAAAATMVDAAEAAAAHAPPWWVGEVVGHERRVHDVAVLTVRPDQPLEFAAGQYVTVQTARWPRVWRRYSVANAPRPDGTLCLHVRAVPAGWVSGALVRHTKVGDTLMLGPALGAMTLDPDSGSDLLLVAGGTGLAPLKALLEQATTAAPGRRVHLVWGARTARDLYDLDELRSLEAARAGLRVTPVVAEDPGFDGMRGTVPEALERIDDPPGPDTDVYVCGPTAMVARTVRVLRDLGVPSERVRHDAAGLDAAAAALAPAVPVGVTPP
ncbi:NAD(P)H-flavin reductase [Thermomonospora echinospora]|uniref:nitric oxide dioxygenase n=1 Tax=Thermomonospora echinospora TaxID=1992 RepID=A0A1H5THM8_9ACTN|nr:globin domain-containing protein [Thermomonospora echinospora]SEF61708.1 NAD(P)H-flavin reductase [Thermomonospora echinospora]